MEYEGIRGRGFTTLVVPYTPGLLSHPPWGLEPFDCFIIDRDARAESEALRVIAGEVAASATEWVETFGRNAESLHDAGDLASVVLGRQASIGDGVPMTAWHEELESMDAMVDY